MRGFRGGAGGNGAVLLSNREEVAYLGVVVAIMASTNERAMVRFVLY